MVFRAHARRHVRLLILLRVRLLRRSGIVRRLLLRRGTIRLLPIRLLLCGWLTRLDSMPIWLLRSRLARLLGGLTIRLPGRLLPSGLIGRLRRLGLLAVLMRSGIRAIGRDLPRRLLRLTRLLLVCHALTRSI